MAAYNKVLKSADGTNIYYPITKASNTILDDGTTVEASLPTVTLNGTKTTTVGIYAPTEVGTSGQVLTSTGSGAPSWADPAGGLDIQVSATQPTNQKAGDFWF